MPSPFSAAAYDRRAAKRRFMRQAEAFGHTWAGPVTLVMFMAVLLATHLYM